MIICTIKYKRTGYAVAGFDTVEDAIRQLGATCWWNDPRTLERVSDHPVVIMFNQTEE